MKKLAFTFIVLFTMATVFTGCREEKSAGDAIEDVADDIEDAVD